ncbi:protein ANTAGONIST OF LIKE HETEROCHROMATIN PROTEIN 1-like [Bactrocera tryoni]|uniref:protein ANTAGONIST OF LIKE HETEROCHROMATIN PROTEIN 1-like n=1 Tax=Bactrocera tryoni TaxID=59916 RepID=UPI001A976220|nr:protein ANTAGONIST OF LIKE HETEROCHROMATIN PROTEIN 1-like [Bactrocera tryoni]
MVCIGLCTDNLKVVAMKDAKDKSDSLHPAICYMIARSTAELKRLAVVGASANAHHTIWDSPDINQRDESLLDYILQSSLVVTNGDKFKCFTTSNRTATQNSAAGDGQSVRKVASLFGVGDGGTIKNVTQRIFIAILRLKNEFLYWPNERERLEIVSATSKEMPGCVGYIDGSEIKLAEAPVMQHEIYYSRKRQYSVKLQAICDYKLRIRQVTIGYPGSVHDAKIFSNCSLAKHPERFLSTSQWVAGDSAYPLKPYLITPFRQNSVEHRKEERDLINAYFSKYRVRIENCFGLLKEKFGSLKELKFRMLSTSNKKECNDWIMACCILHNMLISFDIDNENNNEVLMPQFPLS